jgi:lipopolysaccharide export system permease protein
MTIVSRYIFRQTAGTLLLILLSLTGVVWIALALRQLNLVTTQGQDAWQFIKITLLALPNLMALIAPIALLVSAIHVLNRLNGDSELIVLSAGGATIWNVARPLLVLALLVALAVSFVNHLAMPWSLRLLRQYITDMRTDLISQVIQPGRFNSPENNLTFHIRDRGPDGELLGLVMHDSRDQKQVSTYLAERGHIIKQDDSSYLLMQGGHILRRGAPDEPVRIITFEQYAIDLARFEPKDQGIDLKPRERYLSELLDVDPKSDALKKTPGLMIAELHERFSSALYPFAFMLLAVAFVGQAQTTRQNRVEAIVAAFLIAAGCRLAGLAGTNIVSMSPRMAWFVYAIPLVAMALGVIVALRRMRPRPRSRLSAIVSGSMETAIEWVSLLVRRQPRPAGSR